MRPRGAFVAAAIAAAIAAPAWAAFPQDPPNDPLYDANPLPNAANEQWDLASPANGFDRGISVDRAWPLSTGRGVTIADIDVGVQLDHPDLAGRWFRNPGETGTDSRGRPRRSNGVDDDRNGYVDDLAGWDFYQHDNDPTSDTVNAHGTNVAGVLGATADNGNGIAGIAPDSRILPLRTADNIIHQGVRLAEAITYATDIGARAISMSLGADSFGSQLRRSVRYAHRRDAVIAVAIGNEFHFHHHYPQLLDDVLAVGGVNPDTANQRVQNQDFPIGNDFKVHASYSNQGPHIDVVAPTQVPTAEWGGGTRKHWDGTSAATPHVTAVAALVLARARRLGLHLSAAEVIQIIRMTADDLTDPAQGYGPGWDVVSGWGRVNAFRAVKRVARGRIPPVADINSPDWYKPARGTFDVRGAISGRSPTRWSLFLGEGEEPQSWTRLASGHGIGRLATIDASRLDRGGWTLRLRATDANGNVGEDRAYFRALRDPTVKRGYPRWLHTSGEASPALADLDRDGAADIILGTSDGLLRVYSGRTGRRLPGWPQRMGSAPHSGPVARRIGAVRSGFSGTPAVGNIAGSAQREIVATGLDGTVWAWTPAGRLLDDFPYHILLHRPAQKGQLDAAIYSSPALADLNGDGHLDIVFGAADQRIYAINGRGRDLAGWPVLARDSAQMIPDKTKILSSPAIGDLNGDGRPDVVEGTAESYGSTPDTSGRVYAFNRRGKRLPGWPVSVPGLATNSVPLVGEGVPDSPVLADVDGDGDDEVAVASFTGVPELYDGDGSRLGGAGGQSRFQSQGKGATSPATAPSVLALGANAAFGRLTSGGPLRFFGGIVDETLALTQSSPATKIPFEHLLGGWDASTGTWLASFPIPVEGWLIVTAPAIADVDGDGSAEVISGSSGNVLHAFSEDGSEPAGWPKRPAGWLLASPAVADTDGDGKLEVVDVTRDGYLFVWNTPAAAGRRVWPSFRHDLRNTGRYPG